MITFSEFASKNTFSPTDQIVGYSDTALGGEKRWSYSTLTNAVTSVVATTITNTTVLQQALTAGNLTIGSGPSDTTLVNGSFSTTGNILVDNTKYFGGENTSGTVNAYYIPSWSDNRTYLQYGSAGMFVRDASPSTKIGFENNNITVFPGNFLYAYGNVAGGSQRNTAFGGALTHLTTTGGIDPVDPDHNTAMGALAGYNLQNGSYNTFVGTAAGYWHTATSTSADKGGNTIVGAYAGFQLDASNNPDRADSNTVVGAFSLSPPTGANATHTFKAHGNTVIGHTALADCNAGANGGSLYERNVMIGQFAGNNLTNGANNCIHIGYNVVGSSTGNNNVCRIGNSDISSTLITGIYGVGDLGQTVTINSSHRLGSVTSSLRYKKDIETAEVEYSENIIYNSRPVYYRPKTVSEEHREGWSYWGFIAEELAELDPRMVYWAHKPEDYEEYVSYVDSRTGEEARDRRVKEGAERVPDSIFYERFTVHLVKVAQKQKQEIEELKSTVQQLKAGNEALEARLQALEAK